MKAPLREARIILPIGRGLMQALEDALTMLAATFGGFTEYAANGNWQGGHENVRVVDIAYEPNDANDRKLYDIAQKFREAAKQQEVYLRYGNGNVQMVDMLSCMNNGEFDWEEEREILHIAPDDLSEVRKPPSGLDWE